MERWKRWAPLLVLAAAVVAYIAIATQLSLLQCEELHCRNWDLGIFQQSLWSTTHGKILWEAGDYEYFGVDSFFQIHPSFIMFPLAVLYAWAPVPATLLVFQAIVTGLAAVPLYFLTLKVTSSPKMALMAGVLFLAWTPILSSNLYDFHLESMLPLEFFTFFYLWVSRRYWLALAVGLVAIATLEVTPVLLVFVLMFLYWDELIRFGRGFWKHGWAGLRASAQSLRPDECRSVRWGLVMVGVSVAGYVFLRLLQGPFINVVLGYAPTEVTTTGFTPGSFGLSVAELGFHPTDRIVFWLLAYALIGFLPLYRPSTVIMAVPWMAYTAFTPYGNMVHLGWQYGYIIAIPLFLGLPYGFAPLMGWLGRLETVPSSGPPRPRPRLRLRRDVVLIVVFGWLLAANLVISPVDPAMQGGYGPFSPAPAYLVSYTPYPGYSEVQALADRIPPQAPVMASDHLFPLVANDVNAYAILWPSVNHSYPLPFDASHLPAYVFVTGAQFRAAPGFVLNGIWTPGTFVLVGYVSEAPYAGACLFGLDGGSLTGPTYGDAGNATGVGLGTSIPMCAEGYVS